MLPNFTSPDRYCLLSVGILESNLHLYVQEVRRRIQSGLNRFSFCKQTFEFNPICICIKFVIHTKFGLLETYGVHVGLL